MSESHGQNGDTDVIIAGAGPVGLCLANLLGRRGRRVLVIERRADVTAASLAIGITPPSLAVLKGLDLDDAFASRGVPIDTARVFENGAALGVVDFSRLPAEHRFILSLPQSTTITMLRNNLKKFSGVRLLEGVELVGHRQGADGVRVELRDVQSGARSEVAAAFLAGCDGHRSATRRHAGLRWRERRYRPRFMMADFEDQTALGGEAHLYFGHAGSVESFPLPGQQRRWIVQTDRVPTDESEIAAAVARAVAERTGVDLSTSRAHFRSSFRPGRALASRYGRGRVLLCGDAAHVMSPIGGQGMNTGFADAAHLDRVLDAALDNAACLGPAAAGYDRARRRAFRVAAGRAACGMWLGTRRGGVYSALRRLFIGSVLLRPSFRRRLAPYFAMLTIPHTPGLSESLIFEKPKQ
jgi:2-polyprenyl-6-methoxyphenol hydroxylase-like FAD-dependent oxidoreductase